jgi:hypothetical protein
MANILGLITINNKQVLEVDADPSLVAGTAAPMGTLAQYDSGSVGLNFIKIGAADTAWDRVVTYNSGGNVASGQQLRLAVYDGAVAAPHVADQVLQNAQAIDIAIASQAGRTAALQYNIPNPGNAITSADFVLTEGAQTINGNKTFSNDMIVNGNFTVNGTLSYLNSTQTTIADPLITLNKGGAASSGAGVGFEIEEGGAITGYLKTSADRMGYLLKAPAAGFYADLDMSLLTANRVMSVPDTAGVFVARPAGTPGVATQIAFWQDANNIVPAGSGLTWSGTVLSAANLTVPGALTLSAFTQGSVVFAGASGALAQDNSMFFWDDTTFRLGLGNAAPARTLDVSGQSIFRDALRLQKTGITNGSYDILQGSVQTTTAAAAAAATIAVPANTEVLVEARIMGFRTGGTSGSAGDSACYVRTAHVKNVAGTVTIKNLQTDFTSEDQASWDGTFAVSSTNVLVNVKGAVNNNVDWFVTYTVQQLN